MRTIIFKVYSIHISWLFLFALFISSSLKAENESANGAISSLRGYIRLHDEQRIAKAVRDSLGSTINLPELLRLAHEEQYRPLMQAIKATDACLKLDTAIGLDKRELIHIAFFIETQLTSYVKKKKFYLPTQVTHLARIIEYDPETGCTFIHLGTNNIPLVGRGSKKIVTKSILYDAEKPEILARCEQTCGNMQELKISKKLHGQKGIIQIRAETVRVEKGIKHYTMFFTFYPSGTLADALNNSTYNFSLKEKISMASTILKGLEAMHKKSIVHRDLHPYNYLLNISKNKKTGTNEVEVVIADLGLARFVRKLRRSRVQGDLAFAAPEGFLPAMQGKDYYQTDLFAAGCLFYRLAFGVWPEWQELAEYLRGANSSRACHEKLHHLVEKYIRLRRSQLQEKTTELSPKVEFENLILQILDPHPSKRPTVTQARKKLERTLKQLQKPRSL